MNKPSDEAEEEQDLTSVETDQEVAVDDEAFGEEIRQQIEEIVGYEISERFSGPIPSPLMLRAYADIDPGLVKTIVDRAGLEQTHRHSIESKYADVEKRSLDWAGVTRLTGQLGAVLLGAGAIFLGVYAISRGHALAGVAPIVVAITGMVYAFVKSRQPNDSSNDES